MRRGHGLEWGSMTHASHVIVDLVSLLYLMAGCQLSTAGNDSMAKTRLMGVLVSMRVPPG